MYSYIYVSQIRTMHRISIINCMYCNALCTCVTTCIYIRTYCSYTHLHTQISRPVLICICILHTHVYIYIVYICIYIHAYTHAEIYLHVHKHMNIHIFKYIWYLISSHRRHPSEEIKHKHPVTKCSPAKK